MSKLYFSYAAMNAGKSTVLLQASWNYQERGMRTLLFTSALYANAEEGRITSRIGINANAHLYTEADDLLARITREHKDKARRQLGSSGSGNHFVEFGLLTIEQRDEELLLEGLPERRKGLLADLVGQVVSVGDAGLPDHLPREFAELRTKVLHQECVEDLVIHADEALEVPATSREHLGDELLLERGEPFARLFRYAQRTDRYQNLH